MEYLKLARNAIENTYDSLCDVIEYQNKFNDINKRTEPKEVLVLEKMKCRLSYKTIGNTNQSETDNKVIQAVKLFIAPEIFIKTGSKINVSKNGRVVSYKNSGEPAIYDTHQEIILEVFKGWA